MTVILAIICLVLALACYVISQLQREGKLRWTDENKPYGFFGEKSDRRKYKNHNRLEGPAFFLSTTVLVFVTDGYHFMQFMFFNFLALGFTLAINWNWWLLLGLLVGIRLAHWAIRETFKKDKI